METIYRNEVILIVKKSCRAFSFIIYHIYLVYLFYTHAHEDTCSAEQESHIVLATGTRLLRFINTSLAVYWYMSEKLHVIQLPLLLLSYTHTNHFMLQAAQ